MTVIGNKRIEIKLSELNDGKMLEKAGFTLIEGDQEKKTPELQLFKVVDKADEQHEEKESDN